jgi:spore germination protein GerM
MIWKAFLVMWYDSSVAKRKSYGRVSGRQNTGVRNSVARAGGRRLQKSKKRKIPAGLIFWTAFLVLVAGLFFINRDHIRESLENTRLLEKISSSSNPREEPGGTGRSLPEPAPVEQPSVVQSSPRPIEQRAAPVTPLTPDSQAAPPAPSTSSGAVSAAQTVQNPAGRPAQSYMEQVLYFIHVDDDGDIIRSKVTRRIPVSGTPLRDTLEALIAGPGSGETDRGLISLIPPDTRVLSAVIEGGVARVNFSEEFQYNTTGMEGFAAQLTQVIWTATEFPNVREVQILIEGNRIEHLGEAIPIWDPLNRRSF